MEVNIENIKVSKEIEKVLINNYHLFCKGILNKYNRGEKSVWVRVVEDKGDISVALVSPRKTNIEERYNLDDMSLRRFKPDESYCKYLYNILSIFTKLNLNVDKITANVRHHRFDSIYITRYI